jgi:quinol monooxygenase YgiN
MPVTYVVRMTAKGGQEDAARNRLLSNVPRIQEEGERGNLAFAVHHALDDPRTFWLYEAWANTAAVEPHENGGAGGSRP